MPHILRANMFPMKSLTIAPTHTEEPAGIECLLIGPYGRLGSHTKFNLQYMQYSSCLPQLETLVDWILWNTLKLEVAEVLQWHE